MLINKAKVLFLVFTSLLLISCSNNPSIVKDTLEQPVIHNVYNFNDKPETDVLSICNSLGDIKITKSSTNDLKVVENLVQTKDLKDIDKKLNNLLIKPKIENGVIFYEPLYANDEQRNFWEWIYTSLNANGISINFNIEIPSTIKELRVYNSLGNIDLENITAKIYAQTDMGHINGKNITPLDNTIFKVNFAVNKRLDDTTFKVKDIFDDAPGINVDFSNINNVSSITAGVKFGKILFNLPSNSKYVHQQVDLKDMNVGYPFSITSRERFRYCREQSLKPPTPITEKSNETVISTATINNLDDVYIKTD